jgi:uncharacterized LabA/DUF88 family protein
LCPGGACLNGHQDRNGSRAAKSSSHLNHPLLLWQGYAIAALYCSRFPHSVSEGELESVAIFVDVQNIYYTTRQQFSRHFDYNRFWAEVTKNRKVVKAIAFAIDRDDEKQRQFQNILRAIGFEVRLKPFIQRRDGSAKGDWDVGITLEVLEYAPQADVVVLATGDGDFDLLVHKIREKHRLMVEVYGVEELSAGSLMRAADRFIPIKEPLLLGIK